MSRRLTVWAPDGMGEVGPGDDLARLIGDALLADAPEGRPSGDAVVGDGRDRAVEGAVAAGQGRASGGAVAAGQGRASEGPVVRGQEDPSERDLPLAAGDVVVVTSKVVSKAEGRVVAANDREQAITDETVRVVAVRERADGPPLRIVENRFGLVLAAAGVDSSNTPQGTVLLLPVDPDASARRLRQALEERFGVRLAVVVTDTVGRPWREGLTDIAIGAAGLRVVEDLRGGVDTHGRPLTVTTTAVADEVAAASELVRGKTAGRPVAVVRGLAGLVTEEHGPGARALVRDPAQDMFREGSVDAYRRGHADGAAGRPARP